MQCKSRRGMGEGHASRGCKNWRCKEVSGRTMAMDHNVIGALQERIKNAKRELERCRRGKLSRDSVHHEHVVTPDFTNKTECIKLYVCQDQFHTYSDK